MQEDTAGYQPKQSVRLNKDLMHRAAPKKALLDSLKRMPMGDKLYVLLATVCIFL